jgi:hypothetical protein
VAFARLSQPEIGRRAILDRQQRTVWQAERFDTRLHQLASGVWWNIVA